MRFWATGRSRRGGVYVGRRSSLLAPLRIVRDVLLAGASDAERVGRDVVGDNATRSGVRAVADFDGGDERGVHARADARADRGPVLVLAVVVRGDVARADVRAFADIGVTDVGQ